MQQSGHCGWKKKWQPNALHDYARYITIIYLYINALKYIHAASHSHASLSHYLIWLLLIIIITIKMCVRRWYLSHFYVWVCVFTTTITALWFQLAIILITANDDAPTTATRQYVLLSCFRSHKIFILIAPYYKSGVSSSARHFSATAACVYK